MKKKSKMYKVFVANKYKIFAYFDNKFLTISEQLT